MSVLSVEHVTVYRYRRPVSFGEHQMMFRPRDSHDLRLIDARLLIDPPAQVRWMHDVFSNSIAVATFSDAARELRFESRFKVEHFGLEKPEFPISPFARSYPFTYPAEQLPDLALMIERQYPDPEDKVGAWAKGFADGTATSETQALLEAINRAIKERFRYEERSEPGTRTPVEIMAHGGGTCRDFALFMMEAVRSLGLAARFVTGYLYDPALEDRGSALQGAGSPHAWVQIFLPGAGWVEFDPTNGLVGGGNLIRVAVTRDPSQAVPLQGTYVGAPEDFLEMEAWVRVTIL
jgi:transglutaminase-like putative cysteine protease